MTEFVCAMVGLLLGAALYALGIQAGRNGARPAPPEEPGEEEAARLRKIEAEQSAFRTLMNYNADVAYGTEPIAGEDGV